MTFEEFKKSIEQDLFFWISKRDRPRTSWYHSLEEWAEMRYHESYRLQYGRSMNG